MIVLGVPVIRRYDLLWRFLESLKESSLQPDSLVVVDNGGEISQHLIQLPGNSLMIPPQRNVGCAGAWNLILDTANDEDFVIISNDDIELHPDSLKVMVESGADFVEGHGFSLFGMRKSLVHQVGFFDENFFPAYFEDNDYCRRLKLAGVERVAVDAKASHAGSASLHCQSQEKQREFGKVFEGLRSYYIKKWGRSPHKGEIFKVPFKGNYPEGWQPRPRTR